MSIKTFFALVVVLAGLVAAAVFLNKKPEARVRVAGVAGGDLVFRELDVNNINAIELGFMTSTIRLSRAESGWVSGSLFDYPADFAKIAGFLRKLNEIKVGQVLREGEAMPSDLGLDPQAVSPDKVAVTLSYAGTKSPVSFTLGANKETNPEAPMGMGAPQGRFMRVGDGPIIQISELFMDLDGAPENWVNRELLQIGSDQIASVEVSSTNGTFTLSQDPAGPYKLADQTETEQVDDAAAARLFQGLQWLRFDGVTDPALADADAGISEFDTVKYTTKTGVVYQMEISRDQGTATRTMRIKASDQSEAGSNAAIVEELNRKFAGWRYRMPAGSLSQLVVARESLIAKPAEEPAEAAPAGVSQDVQPIEEISPATEQP